MTTEYAVLGEHWEDDEHLLLLGDDGQHYDYHLSRDQLAPIEPDDHWIIDGQHGNGVPLGKASVLP